MRRVALTGGIGSGKSEVERRLAAHGAVVVDADRLAREVVEPGTAGLAAVVAELGADRVLAPDGSMDRAAVATLVFADPDARRRLEAVVHPLVGARAAEIVAAAPADAVVVYSVPLLVESGPPQGFDAVVVVDAPDDVRLDRLVRLRGMDEADARARMAAQATREQRLAVADHVIDNSGSLAALAAQVDALWEVLSEGASAPSTS
ncbi:MAG: dephospho-CoA kinase [Nocardioides sp.]